MNDNGADNVIPLPVITTLPIPAERILARALAQGLDQCVVVGFDKDGQHYFASTHGDSGVVLYHLIKAQWRLMKQEDAMAGE